MQKADTMARLTLDKEGNFLIAQTPKLSGSLVSKLRKLGWKKGQCVYWDRNNFELKFFDSRQHLHEFLNEKRKHDVPDPLDELADVDLKVDQFEKFSGQ